MKDWKNRNGVWVETDQGVGIRNLEKVSVAGGEITVAKIDLVNADGSTAVAGLPEASLSGVRIARAASIPHDRVAHLTSAQLAALGYV